MSGSRKKVRLTARLLAIRNWTTISSSARAPAKPKVNQARLREAAAATRAAMTSPAASAARPLAGDLQAAQRRQQQSADGDAQHHQQGIGIDAPDLELDQRRPARPAGSSSWWRPGGGRRAERWCPSSSLPGAARRRGSGGCPRACRRAARRGKAERRPNRSSRGTRHPRDLDRAALLIGFTAGSRGSSSDRRPRPPPDISAPAGRACRRRSAPG